MLKELSFVIIWKGLRAIGLKGKNIKIVHFENLLVVYSLIISMIFFRYSELLAIHGKLDPLVNVDLRPEKRVKVTFTYGDISEVRTVDVYR